LNGGSEVMVYSADDLTLSDLPNGDHTIVFSLVDPNHQPFDPAIEATVEFSTFDGTAQCGETVTYTQVNSSTFELVVTAPEGQNVSVTVNGQIEESWDGLVITDSSGATVNAQEDGVFEDAVFESDGTMTVTVTNDVSVNYGDITFVFACAAPQTAVTFNVDMSNYGLADGDTVHVNGEFTGWCGDCGYNVMSDDNGDGIYSLTLQLDQGSYFWKYTVNGWNDQEGFSEAIDGCTANNNGNFDRQVVVGAEAVEVSYCYNTCEAAGACPVPAETYDVTFSVDTSNYNNGEGIADTDQLYVSGTLNGWSGQANPMSDDDGDGIWEVTIALEDGDYEYKFTMNNWAVQEEFGAIGAVEGCTVEAGGFVNRSLTVAGQDMILPTVYWNLCPGETPGEIYNVTFNLDATAIEVGPNGMYMGGGFLGGSNAVMMSDEDEDGVWTVTIAVSTDQIGGNYTFLNSPDNDNDYDGKKEDISGQDCADAGNYNDRIMPEFSGDAEFCYVFAVCTDGSCEGFMSTTDTEILDMRIYPNPTSSMINVQFDRDIELTLYNMLGQEIMRTNEKQVDISALQNGNYIVLVRDLESNYVRNFNIIKK
jgi:phage gp45-like